MEMGMDEKVAKPETYGLPKNWSASMMGMMTLVRVLPPEKYDEIMALKSKPGEAKPMMPKDKPAQTAQSQKKMDMKTAMLYSKALEEEDAGNKTKAVELYRQVVSKFPDYAPAKQKITKLGG